MEAGFMKEFFRDQMLDSRKKITLDGQMREFFYE